MTDAIWKRDEIESPCIKLCIIDPKTRQCAGCHRTIDEIGAWGSMKPEIRRAIMDELPERGAALKVRRGGRAGRLKQL
jgi:predicted Fe-S protein YdhL (DUF1289 family)